MVLVDSSSWIHFLRPDIADRDGKHVLLIQFRRLDARYLSRT